MARFGHRFGSIASVLALVGGMLLAPASAVAAATCEVTNAGTGTTYRTLQEAVDGSEEGDTLEVGGTCIGETVIRTTRLRLKGIATPEQPTPTLDGARLSRVLTVVSARVVIRDLAITNGKARSGGGINVSLANFLATRPLVTLRGDTSVTGNTARWYGGGIYNVGGTVILNDSASVTGNTAGTEGGGIFNYGDLILNGLASVTGNTAEDDGGGIYNVGGTVILNDSASVTGNTAGTEGGGIFTFEGRRVFVCSDEVAISPNDPDDPPKVRHVCP